MMRKSFVEKMEVIVVGIVILGLLLEIFAYMGIVAGALIPFGVLYGIEKCVKFILYDHILGTKYLSRPVAGRAPVTVPTG